MSLDGFVAGPNQSVDNPLGSSACPSRVGFPLATWRAMHVLQRGEVNASTPVVEGWGATLSSSRVGFSGCHRAAVAGQAHALLGCTFLFVLHHVNELPQWIANVETAHTPRFALGAVFNWQACFPDPCESYLDVINLD